MKEKRIESRKKQDKRFNQDKSTDIVVENNNPKANESSFSRYLAWIVVALSWIGLFIGYINNSASIKSMELEIQTLKDSIALSNQLMMQHMLKKESEEIQKSDTKLYEIINKLQSKFGQKSTSASDTLFVDLGGYSSGPLSTFSAGLVQYLDVNGVIPPPFERFTINTGGSYNKIYDIPYILNVTIPARMTEFYYFEDKWIGIDPALPYLQRVDNTFIGREVSFSKQQFEDTFKYSSHLSMLSFVYPKIDLSGDFDFNVETHYSIKLLEIAYLNSYNNNYFDILEAIIKAISRCSLSKSLRFIGVPASNVDLTGRGIELLKKYGLPHISMGKNPLTSYP